MAEIFQNNMNFVLQAEPINKTLLNSILLLTKFLRERAEEKENIKFNF